jgi:phosphomevalonate kinase
VLPFIMTSTSVLTPKAVSAPGKVLLAGGYLVLDRGYTGLVFGLDARIHVYIEPVETSSGVVLSEIIVQSPQFKEAAWRYGYRLSEQDGGVEVTQLRAYVFFLFISYSNGSAVVSYFNLDPP